MSVEIEKFKNCSKITRMRLDQTQDVDNRNIKILLKFVICPRAIISQTVSQGMSLRGGPAGGRGGHLPTGRLHLNSKSTFSFLYLKHFPFCHQTGFDCYLLFEIGEIGFLHWPTWLSFCPCLTYVQAEVEGSWLKRHHLNVFKQP